MLNNFPSLPRYCHSPAATPLRVLRSIYLAALFILAFSFASAKAQQPLTVIHDSGQTVPIGQLYSSLIPDVEPSSAPNQPPQIVSQLFPVRTIKMTPGQFTGSQRITKTSFLLHPIFLVGDDAISRNWLLKNKDRLAASRASGMVVNVQTFDAFKKIQQLIPGIPVAPTSADDIAVTLGVKTYPLLITTDGVATQEVR